MLPFTHRNTITQAEKIPSISSTSSTPHLYKPIKHQLSDATFDHSKVVSKMNSQLSTCRTSSFHVTSKKELLPLANQRTNTRALSRWSSIRSLQWSGPNGRPPGAWRWQQLNHSRFKRNAKYWVPVLDLHQQGSGIRSKRQKKRGFFIWHETTSCWTLFNLITCKSVIFCCNLNQRASGQILHELCRLGPYILHTNWWMSFSRSWTWAQAFLEQAKVHLWSEC